MITLLKMPALFLGMLAVVLLPGFFFYQRKQV